MKKRIGDLFKLFFTFFKIGLCTFGGGYAMIAILHNEFVSKKKFFTKDEFLDLIAICESTPGPIAINMATFIGYKNNKISGYIFATIGVILPAFFIISIIAYFIKDFLEIELVANAFRGIKAGIVVLILFSGFNMFKSLNKRLIWIIVFGLVIVLMVLFELIGPGVDSAIPTKLITPSYVSQFLTVTSSIIRGIIPNPPPKENKPILKNTKKSSKIIFINFQPLSYLFFLCIYQLKIQRNQ